MKIVIDTEKIKDMIKTDAKSGWLKTRDRSRKIAEFSKNFAVGFLDKHK